MIGDILNILGTGLLPKYLNLVDGKPIFNSSFGVIFGSKDDWIIGAGRNTNIIGPEGKLVVDWQSATLGQLFSKIVSNPVVKTALIPLGGTSGDTALVIGDKTSMNYWGKTIAVNRLRGGDWQAKWEEKNVAEPKLTPAGAILCVGLLLLLGLVITVRVVFTARKSKDTNTKNWASLAEEISQIVIPSTERIWFGSIECFEKITAGAYKTEKQAYYANKKEVENQKIDVQQVANNIIQDNQLNLVQGEQVNDLNHNQEQLKKIEENIDENIIYLVENPVDLKELLPKNLKI